MGKLPRYVMGVVFWAMCAGVFGLWLLQMVFAYLSELESVGDGYSFVAALQYIGYRSPYYLGQFIPTGVLLGAVVGLGLLSSHSEIVIMRASGISLYRIIGWAMMPAFVFVLLALAVNEWLLPPASWHANAIKNPHEKTSLVTLEGYWAVVPDENGGRQIVQIGKADEEGNLMGVRQFEMVGSTLNSALSAKTGTYVGGEDKYTWQLDGVNKVSLANGHASTTYQGSAALSLPINQTSVHLLTKPAEELSISELYAHKALMAHQHTHSKAHELAFWQKLLSPFSVLALLLVACSFVFGSLRSQSLGFRIVVALLTGLLFSYLQDLAGFVALATTLPPFVMVLLPIFASALIGSYLLTKKR